MATLKERLGKLSHEKIHQLAIVEAKRQIPKMEMELAQLKAFVDLDGERRATERQERHAIGAQLDKTKQRIGRHVKKPKAKAKGKPRWSHGTTTTAPQPGTLTDLIIRNWEDRPKMTADLTAMATAEGFKTHVGSVSALVSQLRKAGRLRAAPKAAEPRS